MSSTKYDEEKLLFDPKVFQDTKQESLNQNVMSQTFNREMKKTSKTIFVVAIMSVVIAVVSLIVTGGVLYISTTLNQDRKIMFGCILVVCVIALMIIVCVSRHDPRSLLIFSHLLSNMSMLALGLSITYA